MKLYRITFATNSDETCQAWFSSRREAERAAKRIHDVLMSIEAVEMPTGKRAIIAWLNEHAKSDACHSSTALIALEQMADHLDECRPCC